MSEEELSPFYLPEKDQSFRDDMCFLCGEDVSFKNTLEHVFPKWLQKEFDLWNKQIILLNGTTIPYKSLTIPCCEKCNNEHLSKIEKEIFTAYKLGYKTFKNINRHFLFLWISKIYYGILFKELLLPLNRANKLEGTIVIKEDLEKYSMAHLLLQGARVSMEFQERNPWSIFIFNSQVSENKHLNFDYRDAQSALTFGIRIGEISIIAVLQDNSAQAEIFDETIRKIQKLKLHPIQFQELFAKISYKQLTLNRTPKYLITQTIDKVMINPIHLQGISLKDIYDKWDEEVYSHVLSYHTNVAREKLFVPPNQVMTYLYNDDGSLKYITDDDYI